MVDVVANHMVRTLSTGFGDSFSNPVIRDTMERATLLTTVSLAHSTLRLTSTRTV